jgi:hypothetical protein
MDKLVENESIRLWKINIAVDSSLNRFLTAGPFAQRALCPKLNRNLPSERVFFRERSRLAGAFLWR